MIVESSAVLAIDQWLTKSPFLNAHTQIDDLGYKQLNDLLLLNHFPHLAESTESPLGQMLSHYRRCLKSDLIRSIDFEAYKSQAAKILGRLPSFSELRTLPEGEVRILSHDLAYITYTLERWGQFSERSTAGETSKSFQIEHLDSLSLYAYLTNICPKFNTIETFALSFVDEVESFIFTAETLSFASRAYRFSCPFKLYDETKHKSRYPSELSLSSFHVLIKKCELIGQCYNDLILDLFKLLMNGCEPFSETSIKIIDQIIGLVRFSQHLMLEFLRDDSFDEEKFAYILRQITVETNPSPFDVLFNDVNLPHDLRLGVKGLANHFLKKRAFNALELDIFLSDLNIALCGLQFYSMKEKNLLIDEVSANKGIGPLRYRFTLCAIWQKYGLKKRDLDHLLNDTDLMSRNIERLNELGYEYAPSGANSLAFFGLDILIGVCDVEPNYITHILNRLSIMTEFDNNMFWQFVGFIKSGVPDKIRSSITRAMDPLELCVDHSPPDLVLHYVVLFEEISRLSSIHQGMVNRFLIKFSSRMSSIDKRSLTSSLEHGTTFMPPGRSAMFENDPIQLPSLGSLNNRRRSHYLKDRLGELHKSPIARRKIARLRRIDPTTYERGFC